MKQIFIAALVGVLVSGPVWAGEFDSGNFLLSTCQGKDKSYCMGYILGVYDSLKGPNKGFKEYTFCTSGAVNMGQINDVVKKWLEDNPSQRHLAAHSLIAAALNKAFPCR